jgi:hypothetical protein
MSKFKPQLSPMLEIMAGRHKPINGQAAHGINWSSKKKQLKKRSAPKPRAKLDTYGNNLKDPTVASKAAIERIIDTFTPNERAAISPRQKWDAVEFHQNGKIAEALALLRQSAGSFGMQLPD